MTTPGAAYFTTSPGLSRGLYLDGRFIEGGEVMYPAQDWASPVGATILPTVANTDIAQLRWLGGNAPTNLNPMSLDVEVQITNETDYWIFQRAAALGIPVTIFFDYWIADYWYIPGKASGQTTWITSRLLPWSLDGISHATRPPAALVDGVAQTIVTTGTPGTGEVKVPTSGGDYGTITTPSGLTGTYLELRYPPIFLVVMKNMGNSYRNHNDLRFSVSLVEQRAGVYTAA